MIDLNALQKYMDFYKSNLQQPDYSAHNGFNPTPNNPSGDAAAWAMRAMGGNDPATSSHAMPDYFNFGGSGGQAGPPPGAQIGANPFTDRVQATQSTPYAQSPISGQVTNYLSRLLKR